MTPLPRTLPASLLFAIVLVPASAAHATPVEWKVEDGGNGHFYDFIAYPGFREIGWNTARAHAEGQTFRGVHGHLTTLTSAAEQAFFASLPRETNWIYYLGGSQDFGATKSDEGWSWVTGEPWDYTAWATNGIQVEPSDTVGGIYPGVEDGTENYLSTYPNPLGNYSMWNDIGGGFTGSMVFRYAIEFDLPEPSSAAALPIVGLALLRRTRRPRG